MALSIIREESIPAFPADRQKNCIYLVKPPGANNFDIHLVNAAGEVFTGFGDERFTQMFEAKSRSFKTVEVVPTIRERDQLRSEKDAFVYVLDATRDETVTRGSALYLYIKSTDFFLKVFQSEPEAPSVSWDFISARPNSTPDQIDKAVTDSHTHDNALVLNELGDDGSALLYKGKPVTSSLVGKADW